MLCTSNDKQVILIINANVSNSQRFASGHNRGTTTPIAALQLNTYKWVW